MVECQKICPINAIKEFQWLENNIYFICFLFDSQQYVVISPKAEHVFSVVGCRSYDLIGRLTLHTRDEPRAKQNQHWYITLLHSESRAQWSIRSTLLPTLGRPARATGQDWGKNRQKDALALQNTTSNISSCRNEFQIMSFGNKWKRNIGLYEIKPYFLKRSRNCGCSKLVFVYGH
jgi:hypothetical protein